MASSPAFVDGVVQNEDEGHHSLPRAGHAGILIGDKWYIAGGETRGQGELSVHEC
jgi:hypothetical protein